jgi:hypothetical protein
MSLPVDSQILAALSALLLAAGTDAGTSVHVHRTEADAFEPSELPAINLLAVEEGIQTQGPLDASAGGAVHTHSLQVVVQVITSGGSAAAAQARLVSAQCAQAIGLDTTLGGLCRLGTRPAGKQWLHDDEGDTRLLRQNNLWVCGYRTHSTNPFVAL